MALRDVNIFEKHVEKIVIGAAGAGALFMIYLAVQPITVSPQEPIAAGGVEPAITQALNDAQRSMDEIKKLGAPAVQVPDYAQIYKNLAGMRPLEPTIVAAAVPHIGAANISPQAIVGPHIEDQTFTLTLPEPVPAEAVTAKATQYMVTTIEPAKIPNPIPDNIDLPTEEKKVVVIQGWIPVGRMMKEMLEVKDLKERIPQEQQRVAIQNIKVMRQEIAPAKSAWTEVQEPKGETPVQPVVWSALPDDALPTAMDSLDQQFKQIVIPDFLRDAHGAMFVAPILSEPVPKEIVSESKDLQAAIDALRKGFMAGGGTAAAPDTLPTDPQLLRQRAVVPFTFWDDTVEAGHTYSYKVTVEFANPVYGWQRGLKNPADKSRTTLAAAPVTIDKVHVNADVEFFVSDSDRGAGQVDVRIFKQSAGNWYNTVVTVPVGARIAGTIPHTGGAISVDTHYSLVDIKSTSRVGGSASVHAVLSDPQGNLVTRDSDTDWHSPEQQKLLDAMRQAAATSPATAPAAQPTRVPAGSSAIPLGSAVGTPAPRGPTTRSIPSRPGAGR